MSGDLNPLEASSFTCLAMNKLIGLGEMEGLAQLGQLTGLSTCVLSM